MKRNWGIYWNENTKQWEVLFGLKLWLRRRGIGRPRNNPENFP